MINELRTSYLLPSELSETVNAYLKVLQDDQPENPFLDRITGLLLEDLNMLNQAITAVRINQLIDDVAAADALRDDLFIGFRDLINAYKRRRDESLVEAYERVWPVIEKAGTRLYSLGYTDQSGKLEAMFAELDKTGQQASITQLNAQGIYEELKAAQEEFAILYQERLELDNQHDYPTLKEARRAIVPHVNSLINALDVLSETEPDTYGGLINKINVITKQVNTSARARRSRARSEAQIENQ
ncbi:MAG: hypothetical protein JXQ90_10435 [Cyclobacteriaceae bacterium]